MHIKTILSLFLAMWSTVSCYRSCVKSTVLNRKFSINSYDRNVRSPFTSLAAASNIVVSPARSCSACSLFATAKKPVIFALVGALVVLVYKWLQHLIWTPSRTYDASKNTVGTEYDAWTAEGILEYYWGEHIHLGYYTEKERIAGYKKKNFIEAKYDFIDRMMEFGKVDKLGGTGQPLKVLDVGCGIGGTSRYLAKKFGPDSSITGITVSSKRLLPSYHIPPFIDK